ncbi:MAG TPA: hypothetical protein VJ461_00330 [Candidatus Nanoarchaeia archaeon]|nr:hypothetical protein [Candidatus Nanoarchaeia archaeon]
MLRVNALGRRGFALQFTWLFVLIAGAIILGFFFSLMNNILHGSDVKTDIKATEELDALIKISLASVDTQKIILFDKKVIFSADSSSTYSEYYVGDSPYIAKYEYNAVFSPNELEGEEVIIQNIMFKAPFRTLPIVYVSNKDIEYVFVNTTFISIISSYLPENLTKALINMDDLMSGYPDNNYDRVVFILDNANAVSMLKLNNFRNANKRLFAVVITPGQDTVYGYGNLTFYHYSSPAGFVSEGSVPFLDLTMIVGGIISHDKAIYECNLRKVLRRINLLSGLHVKRMKHYQDDISLFECKTSYYTAIAHLEEMKESSIDGEKLFTEDFQSLLISINELRTLNPHIIGTMDCPGIY